MVGKVACPAVDSEAPMRNLLTARACGWQDAASASEELPPRVSRCQRLHDHVPSWRRDPGMLGRYLHEADTCGASRGDAAAQPTLV